MPIQCKSKFYRVHLKTSVDVEVYDLILNALEDYKKEVTVTPRLMTGISYSLCELVLFVRMDNPGLFYVDFHSYRYLPQHQSVKIIFSYLYPEAQIKRVEKKIKDRIYAISRSLSAFRLDAYGKELALHDFLATSVKYEHTDSSYHKAHSSVGAILHGRAVCEGYAMAFKLLCDALGLSCIVVFGRTSNSNEGEGHAWNIVKLNGKCYHVDVTWDSAQTSSNYKGYFNLTDEEMAYDHSWDSDLLPRCTATEDNFFVRSGAYITSSVELKSHIVSGLKKGKKEFFAKINHKFKNESILAQIISEAIGEVYPTCPFLYSYEKERDLLSIFISS
ncbi:MAG: transglutaminase domain-containing protein [Planctomycetia bacterium]|nr:transglutaminase domain-containing protein [Planctomycetia bacterium]